MGNTQPNTIFSVPEKKTEEEKKKEWKKKQEEINPFLKKNIGKKVGGDAGGYSITPNLDNYNGHNGAMKLVIDDFGASVEKYYYYFVNFYTSHSETFFGKKAAEIYKLKDVFDASVSSAFHGQIGSKVSAIQGQVSTYLTQIGQLTKTLLPLVREMRMMDERLSYYNNSFSSNPDETARHNEVTLKSTWVEVVEQGMQNPNSVYSMATKLGFTTLPDLFFATNPHGKDCAEQKKNLHKTLGAIVKQHAINLKVRTALEKKLLQYYTWKEQTYKEMRHTRKFRLKSLKQHYNVIKLYTSWLKPYMTTLKALQMNGKPDSYKLVGSFESSQLELELLIVLKKGKKWNSCVMVRMDYSTRPDLHYTGQQGQRQPVHVGKVAISIEPYVATQAEIDWYRNYTDKEVLKYVSGESVDLAQSIDDILGSLGGDVEDYIYEAEHGKKKGEDDEGKKPAPGLTDPFKGILDSFKMMLPKKSDSPVKISRAQAEKEMGEKKKMAGSVKVLAWITYDVFKKQNGMFTPF